MRLRRLEARTDSARGHRKQQGVYGPRGWKVHSVRGQLRTVRAPGVEGTQRQRAALDGAVFVCAVRVPASVVWLSGVHQIRPWVSQGLWWGTRGSSPCGSTTLGRGHWVNRKCLSVSALLFLT